MTYEPITLPREETVFISARATALFAGGWATEPLAHARKMI